MKKMAEENKLIKGVFSKKDEIAPAYINVSNPKYIEIDDLYYSGFLIVNYNREYNDILLRRIIDTNINMNLSIFYEKQDTYKAIRDLTYNIANIGVEIKDEKNKQDTDIAAFTYNDAKYIRKEIQINNEDIYYLYMYLNVFAKDIKELEYLKNKIEGLLQSIGLQPKSANFRQEQTFLACLPFMQNSRDIASAAKRNVLTSGLIGTYPFISSSGFDEQGIFIGTNIYDNSLVFIDRYNTEKYKNANMCVFGTSGARKVIFYKITNNEK
ncbi:MAG: hypothetical protein ACI4VE_01135 [Clostridia bacterium]